MSMPTDAINAILGIRSGPAHLWPMNETSGAFADHVASGGKTLSPAGGCAPNGWGPLRGYRNNGGPLTPGALFDGSTTGYASATGPTLAALGGWGGAGTGPGASILVWMDGPWGNMNLQCLYAEASPSSVERLALYVDGSGGGLALRYADASASATALGAGNVLSVSGGQSITPGGTVGPRGGQLLCASIQPDGSVQFYRNAKAASAVSTNKLPAPAGGSNWTDASIATYVGLHPTVTGSPSSTVQTAVQGSTVSQCGANEQDAPLLYIAATSTTGWLPSGGSTLAVRVGNDIYCVKTAAVLSGHVLLTLTTTLKGDVAPGTSVQVVPYGAVRGTLGWVAPFPFALTATEFDTIYQALTPEPAGGPAWIESRSGPSVPPRGSYWRNKLDDNAPVDPNSAAIVSYWQSTAVAAGNAARPLVTNAIPHIDLDHATARLNPDGKPAMTRSAFVANPDQNTFLSRTPVADGYAPQGPLPAMLGSDAQQGKTSPKLGLHAANFHQFVTGDRQHEPRAPIWHARAHGATVTPGAVGVPVGTHYYTVATVQANGDESSCLGSANTGAGLLDGTNLKVTVNSVGVVTFTIDVQSISGYYYAPTKLRVYHNQTGLIKDYRQRGPDITITPGAGIVTVTFTDDGTLTDNTSKRPYGYQNGIADATTQKLVNATYTNGTGTAGSGVPITFDPIATAGGGNVACGAVPVPGQPVRGVDFPPGTKVAASPAPSQTSFYVTQAVTADSGSGGKTIHVGDWTPSLGVYGQMGHARGQDEASAGGGGTWSFMANPGFLEDWRPSTANNNGPSASSCPEGPGFITCDEFARAAAGDLHAIKHPILIAIGVQIQSGLGSGSRWPAARFDGSETNLARPYTAKEGMRFRFDPTVDPTIPFGSTGSIYASALSSDPAAANAQMAIAMAIRDYGLVDRDSTAGKGFGNIYVEDRPQSGRDSYGSWYGGLAVGVQSPHFMDPIPWASLILLKAFRYSSMKYALLTITADTDGSDTLRNVSDFTNLWPGVILTGTNIAGRSSVIATNQASGTVQLNRPTTGTATGVVLTPQLLTARTDCVQRIIDPGAQQLAPN